MVKKDLSAVLKLLCIVSPDRKIVITSEARDGLSFRVTGKQIPRYARNDNLPARTEVG